MSAALLFRFYGPPCYLLGEALSAGGLPGRFISAGAVAGGIGGRAGAAPVVIPWSLLARGVTSRMPGGAAGGAGRVCCAVWAGGVVPAWLMLELFSP
jgi:hypothetical protein